MMRCPSDYAVWLASRCTISRSGVGLSPVQSPRIQDDVPELWMLVLSLQLLAVACSCLDLLVVLDDVCPAFAKLPSWPDSWLLGFWIDATHRHE